ncbi:WD40 repeat domain-containing protein [Gimesia sp.]|uniref:WD40 repeat domain-containing protein n=1 Tax=Gimesia sp. TaxID=2024833 RepID=UPI003A918E6B
MFDKMIHMHLVSFIADKVLVLLMFIFFSQSASAIEAQKPEISLAERILLENKIQREQFYGDVRLLHSPNPLHTRFSDDGSVLFSQAETVRLWKSDTGDYLGSISGPVRFRNFALLNNSRWLVTIDDMEEIWHSGWYFDVPQVLPGLRIWDVVTSKCLGVRRLKIPASTYRVQIPAIESAKAYGITYLILNYFAGEEDKFDYHELLGFQGASLTPICQQKLDTDSDWLRWDPYAKLLYIYGKYTISAFDPESQKIVWTISPNIHKSSNSLIDQVVVFQKHYPSQEETHENKKASNSVLVTFTQNLKGPELQQWVIIDPVLGKVTHSGSIPRDLKSIKNQQVKNSSESFIYWLDDISDHSFKAIDILENTLCVRIPWKKNGEFTYLRAVSAHQRWHLTSDDSMNVDRISWSESANAVCFISEGTEEIDLFNAKTGQRITSPSGMVNAVSAFSSNRLAASFDYHNIALYEFQENEQFSHVYDIPDMNNSCVALSTDGALLLVGDSSGKASVWNLSTQKEIGVLEGANNWLLCIAINDAHNNVLAGDNTGTFWSWKFPALSTPVEKQPQLLDAVQIPKPEVQGLIKENHSFKLTSAFCDLSTDTSLKLFFQSFSTVEEIRTTPGTYLTAKVITYPQAPDLVEPVEGLVLITKKNEKYKRLVPAVHHESVLLQVKCTPSGRFVLFTFNTGQVIIVDLQDGTFESIIQTGDKEIVDVDFLPGQKMLLVASYRGTISAWNTETYLKTGTINLLDARLNLIRSRVTKKGFDLVLGTRDTGLIIKQGVFQKSN